MSRLPPVLRTDDLPLAELCALRLDGEVARIAQHWTPIDEPDLVSLRALAMQPRRRRELVVERFSAAWIHGVPMTPPSIPQYCVPTERRIAVEHHLDETVREVSLSAIEIVEISGVQCTSTKRTLIDILRDVTVSDETAESAVAHLLNSEPHLVDTVEAWFERAFRVPHSARALRRFSRARVDLQPSLTR